jgi:hypothetical protein
LRGRVAGGEPGRLLGDTHVGGSGFRRCLLHGTTFRVPAGPLRSCRHLDAGQGVPRVNQCSPARWTSRALQSGPSSPYIGRVRQDVLEAHLCFVQNGVR